MIIFHCLTYTNIELVFALALLFQAFCQNLFFYPFCWYICDVISYVTQCCTETDPFIPKFNKSLPNWWAASFFLFLHFWFYVFDLSLIPHYNFFLQIASTDLQVSEYLLCQACMHLERDTHVAPMKPTCINYLCFVASWIFVTLKCSKYIITPFILPF